MKSRKQAKSTKPTDQIRLQKYLSEAGIASRRQAEQMIEAGRVLVNDDVVDQLPAFVNPREDRVIVDGTPVRKDEPEYFLVHKPRGVVCTNRDPAGRPRAIDLLPPIEARLYVVGRLDADSSGLLLMTNDGELAEQVTHPRLGIPKVYRVEVRGQVPADIVGLLKKGVHLAEGKVSASDVEIVRRTRESSILKITLREGRNRQIRRMLARFDHPVTTLKRVQIGPLSLRELPMGACRRLTGRELNDLRKAVRAAQARTPERAARTTDFRRSSGDAKVRRTEKRPTRRQPSGKREDAAQTPPETTRPRRRIVT